MSFRLVFFTLISTVIFSCNNYDEQKIAESVSDAITQYGSKQAFLEKKFVGTNSYKEITKNGDFGLGTFNYVDGEMAAIDNSFMRIPMSGKLHRASDSLFAPFAVVKFFNSDATVKINNELQMLQIWEMAKNSFSDTSKPIAIKVTGKFNFVKTRSVPKQSEPFPSMQEIIDKQAIFEYENISGSMIGYWFPKFMDGVNFPGFHFHFLSSDLKKGGHLLDCIIATGEIDIDYADKLVIH